MKLRLPKKIVVALATYAVATTIHFFHNGIYLDDYPNMPEAFTQGGVFAALATIHGVGIFGFVMLCLGFRLVGYVALALYAVFGFDGLAHYAVAKFSSHTLAMNFTILFEVGSALVLFGLIVAQIARLRSPKSVAGTQ